MFTSVRTWTKDFRETTAAWTEVGVKILGVVSEQVSLASGPDGGIHTDGIKAHGFIWMALEDFRKAVRSQRETE